VRRLFARSGAPVLLAVAALGCASSYDPASKLKTLRVLAVQKDKPYARPGDTVHLQMLVSDPRSRTVLDGGQAAGTRNLSVAWLAGCENPPGDSYQLCLEQLRGNFFNNANGHLDFSLTLSPDIISSRPPPANPEQPRFGTSFVFFAACAGKLTVRASMDSPFACVSDSGATLGADDFVIGYTEVFAYDQLTNHNPILGVNGEFFEVDGHAVQPDCIGDACVALSQSELGLRPPIGGGPPRDGGLTLDGDLTRDAGTRDGGLALDGGLIPFLDGGLSDGASIDASMPPDSGGAPPMGVPPPPSCDSKDPRCFDSCTTDDQDKCPKYTIKVVLDEKSNAESDEAASIDGKMLSEQMWINYYADSGKLDHDVKLLNDATTGWNPEHQADLLVPQGVGSFHVWAVVHDNRGGAQWVRVTLATRSAW
jgi:hypothetical protein